MALNSTIQRVAGILFVSINGQTVPIGAEFSCGYGPPKRDAVIGLSGVVGFRETNQVAFIEGTIFNKANLDLNALFRAQGVTVCAQQPGGKTIALRDSWFAGEGVVNLASGEVTVRWEGLSLEEI